MIDDPAAVARLMEEMRAHLPIPVLPTKELVRTLREQGLKIGRERVLYVKRVFYLGDEGGIACDVTPGGDAKEAFVVSLTHLRIDPGNPRYQPIRAYQRERVRRIAESEQ